MAPPLNSALNSANNAFNGASFDALRRHVHLYLRRGVTLLLSKPSAERFPCFLLQICRGGRGIILSLSKPSAEGFPSPFCIGGRAKVTAVRLKMFFLTEEQPCQLSAKLGLSFTAGSYGKHCLFRRRRRLPRSAAAAIGAAARAVAECESGGSPRLASMGVSEVDEAVALGAEATALSPLPLLLPPF